MHGNLRARSAMFENRDNFSFHHTNGSTSTSTSASSKYMSTSWRSCAGEGEPLIFIRASCCRDLNSWLKLPGGFARLVGGSTLDGGCCAFGLSRMTSWAAAGFSLSRKSQLTEPRIKHGGQGEC